MTFALQSNKISSICLTVRYSQIGFSTEHLEHFQNIAMLNTQPSGQMWGGDEELEAERLNWGRIPIRTLGFWVFVPRAEYLILFCWVRHPAWQRAISISAANWAFLTCILQHKRNGTSGRWSYMSQDTSHLPSCQDSLGPRAMDHLLLLSQQCCAHGSQCLQP